MPRNRSRESKNGYRNDWETPGKIIHAINAFAFMMNRRFVLDIAANFENKKCERFIGVDKNALTTKWDVWPDEFYWGNPPFVEVEAFLEKAYQEYINNGVEGIMLVPSSQETKWFRNKITARGLRTLVIPSRVSFLHPVTKEPASGNVVGSVLVAFIKPSTPLPNILGEPWRGVL